MARQRNTKTHNIFLLNREKAEGIVPEGGSADVDTIIYAIMAEDCKYKEQTLKSMPADCGFKAKLFFKDEPIPKSKLVSFCEPFVEDDQPILKFRNKNASSVLFLWSKQNVFVITTGQGFRMIEDYCTPKFGMLVISIFKKLFRITALDSNGMSSIVHSSKTIYSNEVDFVNIEALDTIFKEVTGRLHSKEKVHELLNLDEKSKKKSLKITGKNFVQFSSVLNFSGLLHLLSILNNYDFSQMKEGFNLVVPIDPKKNREIVAANNQKIIEMLYENLESDNIAPFDLFNKSTNEFISAETYGVLVNGIILNTVEDIEPNSFIKTAFYEYIGGDAPTIELFEKFVSEARVVSAKGESIVTDGPLLDHISGEIERAGKNYYVFYGEYYYLNDSYNKRLNRSLQGKLTRDRFTDMLTTVWNSGDKEDDFNNNASIGEGYIHLHKVKPDYIEFADLMKVEDSVITVIHVKDGFDCDMRALDRQVELSVSQVIDAKNNNNSTYLRQLYQNARANRKGINISSVFRTEDEFVDAIIHREIRFVAAIHPPVDDLLANRSNIAKHCLNAMIMRCFNMGIDFKIDIIKGA